MYSAEDVRNMTDEEARAAFVRVVSHHYGTERWKTKFAREVEVDKATIHRWLTVSRPQMWAMLLVAAWVQRDAAVNHLVRIKTAIEDAGLGPFGTTRAGGR